MVRRWMCFFTFDKEARCRRSLSLFGGCRNRGSSVVRGLARASIRVQQLGRLLLVLAVGCVFVGET